MALYQLLLRRLRFRTISKTLPFHVFRISYSAGFSSLSTAADSTLQSSSASTLKPTSLSARMSFLFEQIDEIDKQRQEKDQALQRIRNWRESKKQEDVPSSELPGTSREPGSLEEWNSDLQKSEHLMSNCIVKKEAELVHPWPEWIDFMERLVQQNYFDHRRKDEVGMLQNLGFDTAEVDMQGENVLDFMRDYETVRIAVINFGKDRFDILRSLSRHDIQMMVGYGCASTDKRVVFSSKLLRKRVHLDEGDVCSSCSLRSSCEKAYLLTNKEDEAQTIDVMRILLTFGFDPIDGSVVNKSLIKLKFPKASVRKLLHDVVRLSSVPIDPNLSPPIIKKPPPKVKQTPPPPKKKVGRYDIEMKKGDWLCSKCDFMNFAKNTVCLQCDAKRPKRQLLPGEWECPQCNFLNYRRNTVCFQCEHNRPPDTYGESRFTEKRQGPGFKMERSSGKEAVSNAWNFDFDDNESDGADVAAFEFADSQKMDEDFPSSTQIHRENSRTQDGFGRSSRQPMFSEREYSDSSSRKPGTGFNDFDEEEDDVGSYDVVSPNEVPETSRVDFSELEPDSESEDMENGSQHGRGLTNRVTRSKKPLRHNARFSDSEKGGVDFGSDDELPVHPNWKSSHVANRGQRGRERNSVSFSSDEDGSDDGTLRSKRRLNRRVSGEANSAGQGKRRDGYSSLESDDDGGHFRDKRGGKARQDDRGKTFMRKSGMMGNRNNSRSNGFDRSSASLRNKKGIQENSYNERGRHAKNSNFPKSGSQKRGGSFDRQGGISKSFANQPVDYQESERHQRPRANVR